MDLEDAASSIESNTAVEIRFISTELFVGRIV